MRKEGRGPAGKNKFSGTKRTYSEKANNKIIASSRPTRSKMIIKQGKSGRQGGFGRKKK